MPATVYNDPVQVEVVNTQSGRQVVLLPDRTWAYIEECEGMWSEAKPDVTT